MAATSAAMTDVGGCGDGDPGLPGKLDGIDFVGNSKISSFPRNCPGTPPNRCRTELLSDERFGFVHDTIHICSRLSRRPSRIEASSKLKKRGTWAVTFPQNPYG